MESSILVRYVRMLEKGSAMKIRYNMMPKSNPEEDYYILCDEAVDEEARIIGKLLNKDGNILAWNWKQLMKVNRLMFMPEITTMSL